MSQSYYGLFIEFKTSDEVVLHLIVQQDRINQPFWFEDVDSGTVFLKLLVLCLIDVSNQRMGHYRCELICPIPSTDSD